VPGSLPRDPDPGTCPAAPAPSVCALDSVIPIPCSKAKQGKASNQKTLISEPSVIIKLQIQFFQARR